MKPAMRRRRRQHRAAPGRRSPASGPGQRRDSAPAADRACRGLVRVSGYWQAAVVRPAWPVLAVLDHRQCFRVFVLSIGEAGHDTTTAPASSSTGWRSPASGPGQRRDSAPATDRAWRGLVVVSGGWQASVAGVCSCWRCSITGKLAVLWSAACSSSSSPWKAIAGKWARATARQRTGSRSGVPWLGQGVGVLASRGCAAGVARAGGARSPAVLPGLRSLDR